MTPLALARHLHRANVGPEADWHNLTEDNRQCYLREAEATLAALRGPRTGEELFAAILAAYPPPTPSHIPWADLRSGAQEAYNHVAATFATPQPPEGWPEGYRLATTELHRGGWKIGMADGNFNTYGCVAAVHGATEEEATEHARLIAHTLASGAPVQPMPAANTEIERLRAALRAETNAHIETKNALAIARRDEQRAQERRQKIKGVAMDLARVIADARMAELRTMIEGADK